MSTIPIELISIRKNLAAPSTLVKGFAMSKRLAIVLQVRPRQEFAAFVVHRPTGLVIFSSPAHCEAFFFFELIKDFDWDFTMEDFGAHGSIKEHPTYREMGKVYDRVNNFQDVALKFLRQQSQVNHATND